ncbi:hypothetical protein H2203_006060 [Taxawa tesnikishii (nom. ined.)]|nr:hypothetical protein H2203_006060 [Dothideales sp. JES 119]
MPGLNANGITATSCQSAAMPAHVSSSALSQPDPVIARSNPYDDLRPFIEQMWMNEEAECRSIFKDMFPSSRIEAKITKEMDDGFVLQFFTQQQLHQLGGPKPGSREKNKNVLSDPHMLEFLETADFTAWFDEDERSGRSEEFLKRAAKLIKYRALHYKESLAEEQEKAVTQTAPEPQQIQPPLVNQTQSVSTVATGQRDALQESRTPPTAVSLDAMLQTRIVLEPLANPLRADLLIHHGQRLQFHVNPPGWGTPFHLEPYRQNVQAVPQPQGYTAMGYPGTQSYLNPAEMGSFGHQSAPTMPYAQIPRGRGQADGRELSRFPSNTSNSSYGHGRGRGRKTSLSSNHASSSNMDPNSFRRLSNGHGGGPYRDDRPRRGSSASWRGPENVDPRVQGYRYLSGAIQEQYLLEHPRAIDMQQNRRGPTTDPEWGCSPMFIGSRREDIDTLVVFEVPEHSTQNTLRSLFPTATRVTISQYSRTVYVKFPDYTEAVTCLAQNNSIRARGPQHPFRNLRIEVAKNYWSPEGRNYKSPEQARRLWEAGLLSAVPRTVPEQGFSNNRPSHTPLGDSHPTAPLQYSTTDHTVSTHHSPVRNGKSSNNATPAASGITTPKKGSKRVKKAQTNDKQHADVHTAPNNPLEEPSHVPHDNDDSFQTASETPRPAPSDTSEATVVQKQIDQQDMEAASQAPSASQPEQIQGSDVLGICVESEKTKAADVSRVYASHEPQSVQDTKGEGGQLIVDVQVTEERSVKWFSEQMSAAVEREITDADLQASGGDPSLPMEAAADEASATAAVTIPASAPGTSGPTAQEPRSSTADSAKKSVIAKPGPKQTEALSPFARANQQKKKERKKPAKGKGKSKKDGKAQEVPGSVMDDFTCETKQLFGLLTQAENVDSMVHNEPVVNAESADFITKQNQEEPQRPNVIKGLFKGITEAFGGSSNRSVPESIAETPALAVASQNTTGLAPRDSPQTEEMLPATPPKDMKHDDDASSATLQGIHHPVLCHLISRKRQHAPEQSDTEEPPNHPANSRTTEGTVDAPKKKKNKKRKKKKTNASTEQAPIGLGVSVPSAPSTPPRTNQAERTSNFVDHANMADGQAFQVSSLGNGYRVISTRNTQPSDTVEADVRILESRLKIKENEHRELMLKLQREGNLEAQLAEKERWDAERIEIEKALQEKTITRNLQLILNLRALWQDRFGYDQQYDNATTPLVPSPSAPLGVEGMRIGRPLNLQERYNTVMNRADAVENDTPQPYDLDPRVWRR